MSEPDPTFVDVRLWDQSALVLLDWLMERDELALPFDHPAQKQALRDLATALEWTRGLDYDQADLRGAQERVARDMSDEDRGI